MCMRCFPFVENRGVCTHRCDSMCPEHLGEVGSSKILTICPPYGHSGAPLRREGGFCSFRIIVNFGVPINHFQYKDISVESTHFLSLLFFFLGTESFFLWDHDRFSPCQTLSLELEHSLPPLPHSLTDSEGLIVPKMA